MFRALLTLLIVTAAPLGAQRSTLPDSTRAKVDEVFAFVDRDAPGCALGVIQDGRLAYGRGYGLANLDWGIPITTSTVFDIGSVSKQFTATAIALLETDGVLSLDDDVRRWIPEMPDYGKTITIRHLLNHTSGVRDYLTLLSLAGFEFANVFDEEDGVAIITRQRALNFDPGSEFLYSNSGYLLLANIVRRASGMSLRALLQARVFDPLGMTRSSVWDDNTEILSERATGYSPAGNGGWEIDHAWNFQMGGDGQVITSIEDLAKWDANFFDPVVGGQALLDRLHTRGILTKGDTIPYALGLTVDRYRGLRRVQHGGAWAGFRAMLARFPEQRTSIVIECNRGDASTAGYADAVADAVLAAAFPEGPTARPGQGAPPAAPAAL
ncbi:MAG: serine hydrolase domain-containing protein, partial [Longimicrobiales bacterium]|nr:serine hydrolase domain-containing protein [Longimicrobiales bacterium]